MSEAARTIRQQNPANRILVVEDEPANRDLLEEFLRTSGYDVTLAEDGEAAWSLLKHGEYAMVITDRLMPRLDGLQLARRIKADQNLRHMPVIMQTGAIAQREVAEGLQAGVYYYLNKPYEEDALLAIVRQAAGERQRAELFNEQMSRQRGGLRTLGKGEFTLRAPDEAEDLAFLLGALFPQPSLAMAGIYELLLNGIEHGNLGLGYGEKDQLLSEGAWEAEIRRRLDAPANAEKRVNIQFAKRAGQIDLTIMDSGAGFDWRPFLEIEPGRAMQSSGRGIAKAKALSFDKLEFVGTGNQVRVSSKVA